MSTYEEQREEAVNALERAFALVNKQGWSFSSQPFMDVRQASFAIDCHSYERAIYLSERCIAYLSKPRRIAR